MTYHLLLTFNPLASVSNRAPSITVTETLFLPGHLYMSPPLPAVSWAAAALSQSHGLVVLFFVYFPLPLFPPACHTIFCWASLAKGLGGLQASKPRLTSSAYCWPHFFATFFESLLFAPCLLAACLQRHLRIQQFGLFPIIRHTKDPTQTITATPVLLQGPQDASAYASKGCNFSTLVSPPLPEHPSPGSRCDCSFGSLQVEADAIQ